MWNSANFQLYVGISIAYLHGSQLVGKKCLMALLKLIMGIISFILKQIEKSDFFVDNL